jgi:Tol biopolymer transport system component
MTDQDLELRLRSWYRADGEANRAPAALRTSVAAIPAQGRRVVRLPWAGPTSRLSFRLAVAAAVAVLAVGGAFYALTPRQPAVGGPSPTPGASSNPTSPAVSPSPAATPRPAAVVAYINYVYRTGSPMVPTGRVWIVNADGSDAHELFPGGTGNQSGVAWSPDGTHLVYRAVPGPGELPGEATVPGLYLTDASGSQPQLVDAGCACSDYDAAFSPDGTQLVVVRGTTSLAIATMNIASGRVVELRSTAAVQALERPRWSPDGTKIVFSRMAGTQKFDNGAAVFVVDADGTNLHQLSAASLPARLPDWSPDGSRIVFTSNVWTCCTQGGTMRHVSDVYTVRPDWTDLRRLTSDGNAIEATWTPDGRILFVTGGSNESGLWVMNADGSNARLLVPRGDLFPNGGNAAAWQPTP